MGSILFIFCYFFFNFSADNTCPEDQIPCVGGTCIDFDLRCNHEDDCPEGGDEGSMCCEYNLMKILKPVAHCLTDHARSDSTPTLLSGKLCIVGQSATA